jgi:hypothetical protein
MLWILAVRHHILNLEQPPSIALKDLASLYIVKREDANDLNGLPEIANTFFRVK